MSDVVLIPDHRAVAVSRLLAQFRDRPKIRAVVLALATGAQAFESEAFGVLVSTTLSAATNVDLDHWGALVGEARGGLDDATYRVMISARILVNRSRGTRDELIRIAQLITAPSQVVHVDVFPACFQLIIRRRRYMSGIHARRAGGMLREAKPGGVAMLIYEAVPGEYFGYFADPDAEPLDLGELSRLI